MYVSDTSNFIDYVLIFRVVTCLKLLRKTLEVKLATSPSKRRFPNSLVRMRSEDSIVPRGKADIW